MSNCQDCGAQILTKRQWSKLSREERVGISAGFGELCASCYSRAYRAENTPRKTWRLEELIEEAEFLIQGGDTPARAAERLGLKPRSLAKAYQRAAARGLTTRRIPEKNAWRKVAA